MSVKLLSKVAPGYGWSKVRGSINIYISADGTVEVSIIKPSRGYSELTFTWLTAGLIVEGWVRYREEDVDAWRAAWGDGFVDVHGLPQLPHGTAEVVWGIFVLIGMAGRKAAGS